MKHVSQGGQVLRWAVITTKNGYAVVGAPSAAVSPANDNEEIGQEIAFNNSKNALWLLDGLRPQGKTELSVRTATKERRVILI